MRYKRLSILLFLALLLMISGCRNVSAATEETTAALSVQIPDRRQLRIDVAQEADSGYSKILPAQAGSRWQLRLCYEGVTDVRIDVGDRVLSLEDALRQGDVSTEDLLFWAEADRQNGFCQPLSRVRNGQTVILYRYPEYDLCLFRGQINDASGQSEPCGTLCVFANTGTELSSTFRENWGLQWEVASADAGSITLTCTQSGGEQLGDLIVDFYSIEPVDESISLSKSSQAQDAGAFRPKPVIEQNTVSTITLNWEALYGALPSGNYVLTLSIRDQYPVTGDTAYSLDATQSSYIPFTVS